MKLLIALSCVLGFSIQTYAQQEAPSPILFIYDASGSMWGQLQGKTKKDIAAEVLATTIGNLPEEQKIGLMAYGHRKKGDCNDIEYLVGINNASKDKITNAVSKMNALGKTPLARSASQAINSLEQSNIKATIILITDGIESCDGNICDVVTKAKTKGIDFKLHIVGFGIKDSDTEQLKCAANAGDGNYYDAADLDGLANVMQEATNETIDDPDGNFSIYATKNGKPVDAWIRARKLGDKKDIDASRTYRDTGWVYLPPGKYDVTITPLEGTDIPGTTINVEINEGDAKHQNISFDGGMLEVMATNNDEGWDAIVKLFDNTTGKQVASVRTYGVSKTMEVPAGSYKLTYQILQLKGLETYKEFEEIIVIGNDTTKHRHNFESGSAMIGVQTANGELIDATVNFHEVNTGKNVSASRTYTSSTSNPKKFLLNPGIYDVKIVTLGKHKGGKESFRITVKKGEVANKTITF